MVIDIARRSLVLAVVLVATTSGSAAAYVAPVPGRVVVPFDEPVAPWAPGHRGVDLAAIPGERVVASGDGTVVFAGTVVGSRWVTVRHGGDLRTSYGPLATVAVTVGSRVREGDLLGSVGAEREHAGTLHWGLRRGGRYVDPLTLLGELRPSLVGPGTEHVTDLPTIASYRPWRGRRGLRGLVGFVEDSPVARHEGWPLPPNPNHVVGIAGLGTSTPGPKDPDQPLDLTHLGYAPEAITYLSYSGRTERSDLPGDPRRDQRWYGPEATFDGVHRAAVRIREQLRAHHARAPGDAVDLVGHSMGGVAIMHYLLTMHDPADPTLPAIGHVVTIASPLEGTDAANAVAEAARSPVVEALLTGLSGLVGLPAPGAHSAQDLAVGSPLVRQLRSAWEEAQADVWASPLATGTRVLTLGGSYDPVVPEHRSDLPGAPHVVLPGAHGGVRDTEAARIVLHRFLADRPHPGADGGIGHLMSYPLGWAERRLGREVRRRFGGFGR